ncbi:MAG: glycosyltransferase family 2 protein [Ignavibacteria bacterium]|jgi:glycosyltransferase involved in cell wall biosynthesis
MIEQNDTDLNQQNANDPGDFKEKPSLENREVPALTPSGETNLQNQPVQDKRRTGRKFYRRNNQNRKYYHPRNTSSPNLFIGNKVISVIIPLYNEEESIVELSITLKKILERIRANYEVIFIDDGSNDGSFQKIKEINHLNSRFKCIKFKRNYGKSAALSEGFKASKGDYVVTMDADLQDDPEEIPALIQKLNEGYDLVSGWKKKRYDPFIKRYSSRFFNFVTSLLVGLKLHDYNCGLKIYKKDIVKNIRLYGEMHRYIPALAFLSGFRVSEIAVTHHPRKFGRTKFGASRFMKGMFDLMTVLFTTKFIKRPLHFFGSLGLLGIFTGFGILIYLTILKFFDSIPISNRPLFLVGILLVIVGIQSFSIGLIAEMITKTSADTDNIIIERTLP